MSPHLSRGLNLGRQIFYFERRFPAEFAAGDCIPDLSAILRLAPRRRRWRSESPRSERTPISGARMMAMLSSMVDKLGWRRLFPPMRKAWDTLGTLRARSGRGDRPCRLDVRVICGAHDSNASLVPHLVSRREPFTVISTGTWVIIMAIGGKGQLDPKADMLGQCRRAWRAGADRALHGRPRICGPCRRRAGRRGRSQCRRHHRFRRARFARILRPGRPIRRAQRRHRGRRARRRQKRVQRSRPSIPR